MPVGQSQAADEACSAFVFIDAGQFVQEFCIVCLVDVGSRGVRREFFLCESRAADAGGAADRIDGQAAVVGQRPQTGCAGVVIGLGAGVLGEGLAVLGGGGNPPVRVDLLQRDDLNAQRLDRRGNLANLAGVPAG